MREINTLYGEASLVRRGMEGSRPRGAFVAGPARKFLEAGAGWARKWEARCDRVAEVGAPGASGRRNDSRQGTPRATTRAIFSGLNPIFSSTLCEGQIRNLLPSS